MIIRSKLSHELLTALFIEFKDDKTICKVISDIDEALYIFRNHENKSQFGYCDFTHYEFKGEGVFTILTEDNIVIYNHVFTEERDSEQLWIISVRLIGKKKETLHILLRDNNIRESLVTKGSGVASYKFLHNEFPQEATLIKIEIPFLGDN